MIRTTSSYFSLQKVASLSLSKYGITKDTKELMQTLKMKNRVGGYTVSNLNMSSKL
jgi:hypothetical protein